MDGAEDLVSDVDGIYNTAVRTIDTALAGIAALVPIGVVLPFPGINLPPGYLWAWGQGLEREQYRALYDAIGTRYGGSGTQFNVPNIRGVFLVGADDVTFRVGIPGGARQHSHTGNVPHHTHSGNAPWHNHGGNMPSHWHGINSDGHHAHGMFTANRGTATHPPASSGGEGVAYTQHTHGIDGAGGHNHGGGTGGPNTTGFVTDGPSATAFTTGGPSATAFTTGTTQHLPPFLPMPFMIRAL